MRKKNSQNPSRRTFLHILLGLPFGMSAVKKVYGHKREKRKLLLNVFSVAGYQFYDDDTVEHRLKAGELLTLKADPDNPYDEFAVEILTANGIKLGYVPKSDNKAISRLLRQGANVEARIEKVDLEAVSWQRMKVGLSLIL